MTEAGLWHVCPTRVFESHAGPQGQVRVVVNADNCIKCETCWRTSDLVDWGRDGELRFAYPVDSTAAARFRKGIDDAGPVRAVAPRQTDVWAQFVPVDSAPPEAGRLIGMLDATLTRFDASLAEGSPIIGRDRAEYLETLARHAQQVARRLAEVLNAAAASRPEKGWEVVLRLAVGLAGKAEERARALGTAVSPGPRPTVARCASTTSPACAACSGRCPWRRHLCTGYRTTTRPRSGLRMKSAGVLW